MLLSSHLSFFAVNKPGVSVTAGLVFLVMACFAVTSHASETPATRAFLVDTTTGTVLIDKNGHEPMPPASMSKLMTLFMVFERLQDGRLSLDDKLYVSEDAWRRGGSRTGGSTMFLEPGMRVRVEDLIRGIIVQSGNDACIVIAEGISGSEEAFAVEMTARARELGLGDSTFVNATGWPHPDHRMSARDIAKLAELTIRTFPEFYHYYSEEKFIFNGISQPNRNPLLYKDMGADGLKTGHTEESGYGLAASAMRGDRRLVLVVSGLASKKMRSTESERLLEWGFREFDNYDLFRAGDVVDSGEVWLGTQAKIPMVIENDLVLTLPKKSRRNMEVKVVYTSPIPAPVSKGDRVATLVVSMPDSETVEVPLVAGAASEKLGLTGRLMAAFNFLVWGTSQ